MFLLFWNFRLRENLLPSALTDFFRASPVLDHAMAHMVHGRCPRISGGSFYCACAIGRYKKSGNLISEIPGSFGYAEKITSGFPQQQQQRSRSYRPWGCCQRPGSPSFPRKIRLSAAFRLRRRDFWSGKPDFSQNKKHIARKRYVVLSFSGLILSHHLFTIQDL